MSDLPIQRGKLSVTAKSSIHDVTAETADVRGTTRLGDGTIEALVVQADLATLRTGDTLKDLELRRRLGDRTGGQAEFRLRAATPLAGPKTRLEGDLTFRGITRPITAEATIHLDGPRARGKATFPVRFTDHGLEPPKVLFLKIQDLVQVTVDLEA